MKKFYFFVLIVFILQACSAGKISKSVISSESVITSESINTSETVNKEVVETNFKNEKLEDVNNPNQLVLSENALADLGLQYNDEDISQGFITEKLSNFNIEVVQYDGYDETGPTKYYIGWKGAQLFSLTLDKQNKASVDVLTIQSVSIVDSYGARIGMNFKQLLVLRPEITIGIDPITQRPICKVENSSISYKFCCNESGKTSFSPEEMANLKITEIVWKKALF